MLATTDYDNPVTSNADSGLFMVTVPAYFWINRLLDRTDNESSLKTTARFFVRYASPLQVIAEARIWGNIFFSPELSLSPKTAVDVGIIIGAVQAASYGIYRSAITSLSFTIHFRGDILLINAIDLLQQPS